MKLKNKKTGEIGTLIVDGAYKFVTNFAVEDDEMNRLREYSSLAELNEEWEDAPEEPKKFWYITACGDVYEYSQSQFAVEQKQAIGNYFSSQEEAELAVRKLKALKRLKDKGFRFKGWTIDDGLRISICTNAEEDDIYDDDKRRIKPDLDLLFGGEE